MYLMPYIDYSSIENVEIMYRLYRFCSKKKILLQNKP